MSFTITTDVFCDICSQWIDGISSHKPERRKAWKRARYAGSKNQPITGKHMCPACVVKTPAPGAEEGGEVKPTFGWYSFDEGCWYCGAETEYDCICRSH